MDRGQRRYVAQHAEAYRQHREHLRNNAGTQTMQFRAAFRRFRMGFESP
ncbi:MAG: hypothetical protein QOC62_6791 [Mycobacterium sp.]|jgi:hypothetical protein|nr:hypothetical protein [Mycobacterium sp.]